MVTDLSDVLVVIPWRRTPDREAAFERVLTWYADRGYKTCRHDSDPTRPFNLSQARNRGAAMATTERILVIADADTIPDERALHSAVRRAHTQMVVFYPFTTYHSLPAEAVNEEILGAIKPKKSYPGSVGGICVMHRNVFIQLGGFDEHFTSWGYEDNAFELAAEAVVGTERINGDIYSFDHGNEHRDMTKENPGRTRIKLYHFARHDRPLMIELLRR